VIVRGATGTILTILAFTIAASPALTDGIASLLINFPSISPNGNGVQDEMTVTVELSSPVDTLIVTVADQTAPAVYDTLIFETPASAGTSTAVWGGTDWTGTVLPEGEYNLILHESTGGTAANITRKLRRSPIEALDSSDMTRSEAGRPASVNTGSFCPLTRVLKQSMAEMPVSMNSSGLSRATGLIGHPVTGTFMRARGGSPPSIGLAIPIVAHIFFLKLSKSLVLKKTASLSALHSPPDRVLDFR
jgi:flagellar hook assembly protein FlgD